MNIGVRFATGMNGDEDLGQDITMKGEKFHYAQDSSLIQTLPLCDDSNGTVGVDCLHSRDYPRKLSGTQYAPHGDFYGSYLQLGDPVSALAQTQGKNKHHHHHHSHHKAHGDPKDNDTMSEAEASEAQPSLPACDGSNGV